MTGTAATAATDATTVNATVHSFLPQSSIASSAVNVLCAMASMSSRALVHIAWCASSADFSTAARMNWLASTPGNGVMKFLMNICAASPVHSSR